MKHRNAPPKPDYARLQDEVERGSYPFDAGDEGELFARAIWLEARLAWLEAQPVVRAITDVADGALQLIYPKRLR